MNGSNLKLFLLIGALFAVLISQSNCEPKPQMKARRGITEWRFKRMHEHASHTNSNANALKINEYEFYLSLLPKENSENELAKPLVFRLDLVIFYFISSFYKNYYLINF